MDKRSHKNRYHWRCFSDWPGRAGIHRLVVAWHPARDWSGERRGVDTPRQISACFAHFSDSLLSFLCSQLRTSPGIYLAHLS